MFHTVNDLLNNVINKFGIDKILKAEEVIRVSKEVFVTVYPEIISDLSFVSFQEGKLYIKAKSSHLSGDIKLRSTNLIQEINKKLDKTVLIKIVVRI